MSGERSPEDRELFVGFQSTEPLGGLHHSSGRPAQRHRGISPVLHVATDPPHGPHHVLDRVGAGEQTPELCRQSEAIDGQHLIEPFKDAGGDTGRLLVEPAGEIAQQPLSSHAAAITAPCTVLATRSHGGKLLASILLRSPLATEPAHRRARALQDGFPTPGMPTKSSDAARPWSEPVVEGRKEQDAMTNAFQTFYALLRAHAKPSAVLVDDFNACSCGRRAGRNAG